MKTLWNRMYHSLDGPRLRQAKPEKTVCPECGGEISQSDLVCPHCGISLVSG